MFDLIKNVNEFSSECYLKIGATKSIEPVLNTKKSKVIGTIGQVLDAAMPNRMKEMLKDRVAQGILKTAGGIFEIKAGVALTIASGGTLTLGGLASAGFGLNNVYEGLQDIWHGARDEEIESYNPLKEFTNNRMNSTLDILNMATGAYAGRAYAKNKGKVAESSTKSDLVDTDLYKNASKESVPRETKSYPSYGKGKENLANEEKFFDFEGRRSSAAECSRQSSRWGSEFEFTPKPKGTGEVAAKSNKVMWGNWSDYPKVTINSQEYAQVGDRLYSRHAVDRMQPSGKRYSGDSQIVQAGGAGKTNDYGRSISPNYVENVIQNTEPVVQGNGNLSYTSSSLQVITNPQGAVVTIIIK